MLLLGVVENSGNPKIRENGIKPKKKGLEIAKNYVVFLQTKGTGLSLKRFYWSFPEKVFLHGCYCANSFLLGPCLLVFYLVKCTAGF